MRSGRRSWMEFAGSSSPASLVLRMSRRLSFRLWRSRRCRTRAGARRFTSFSQYWQIRAEPNALALLEHALHAAGESADVLDCARAQLHRSRRLFGNLQTQAATDAAQQALALFELAGDDA
jgi:hypothetical protein